MSDAVDLVDVYENRLKKYEFSPVALVPEFWDEYSNLDLDWDYVRFERSAVKSLPNDRYGIYTFVIEHETAMHCGCRYLAYIGIAESQSLQQRVSNYFQEIKRSDCRPKIGWLMRWQPHLWIYYAAAPKAKLRQLEDDLLTAMQPPANTTYPATVSRARRKAFRV